MLKLYHSPTSPNSRRVWIALLEKGLEFELIEVKLDGEQFSSKFIEINPYLKLIPRFELQISLNHLIGNLICWCI
jgi:glutathione S-transferase